MDRLIPSLGRIDITRTVLRRASLPMPTAIRTLDTLHFASALTLQEKIEARLVFATHNAQQALAARALGFDCIGM